MIQSLKYRDVTTCKISKRTRVSLKLKSISSSRILKLQNHTRISMKLWQSSREDGMSLRMISNVRKKKIKRRFLCTKRYLTIYLWKMLSKPTVRNTLRIYLIMLMYSASLVLQMIDSVEEMSMLCLSTTLMILI